MIFSSYLFRLIIFSPHEIILSYLNSQCKNILPFRNKKMPPARSMVGAAVITVFGTEIDCKNRKKINTPDGEFLSFCPLYSAEYCRGEKAQIRLCCRRCQQRISGEFRQT